MRIFLHQAGGAFYVMMNMTGFIGKTMYGKVIESAEDFSQLFLERVWLRPYRAPRLRLRACPLELRDLADRDRQGSRPSGSVH